MRRPFQEIFNLCTTGDLDGIKLSIENGLLIGQFEANYVLNIASMYGRLNILDFFIEIGGDIESEYIYGGDNPLTLACSHGRIEIVLFLLKKRS